VTVLPNFVGADMMRPSGTNAFGNLVTGDRGTAWRPSYIRWKNLYPENARHYWAFDYFDAEKRVI